MKNRILPIIVIYQCSLDQASSYTTLLKDGEWDAIAVYDNSPQAADISNWDSRIIYHNDPDNGGLSKAYNWAANIAQQRGYTHILLLDQDTIFPTQASDVYLNHTESNILFAPSVETTQGQCLSPVCIREWYPRAFSMKKGIYSLYDFQPINSGMCIPVSLFKKCGGYNEEVWLDFSDYEFGRKYRKTDKRFQLIDLKILQSYSGEVKEIAQKIKRYQCYLDCARHCTFDKMREKARHQYVVLIDTLWHIKHFKSIVFLKHYIMNYLFKR